MLSIQELLNIVKELNEEIENTIEDMCGIEKFYIETDGLQTILRFQGPIYYTDEEEVFGSKEEILRAILKELESHKTQVDGMIKLLKNKNIN